MSKEKVTEKEEKKESDAKKAFRAIIEAYKVKNPEKYETKKVALEAELSKL
jgi:hypothetical protein